MGIPDEITRVILDAVGEVWGRPVLSHRERSLITISALTALRCNEALRVHINGALNNGLTPEEIYEALLHAGYYAGFGVAVDAFRIAQGVLSEH
jgi:4-carboxymuconolactone decarboxylase